MPEGFTTYDELPGPGLDVGLWDLARVPLPTGEHIPLDSNAEVAVGEGEVRVHIPRFSLGDDFTRLRECEGTLDRSTSTAAWRVDGHTVYEVHGSLIPDRVRLGFGIWTMLPIRDRRSRSLEGQGLSAHRVLRPESV